MLYAVSYVACSFIEIWKTRVRLQAAVVGGSSILRFLAPEIAADKAMSTEFPLFSLLKQCENVPGRSSSCTSSRRTASWPPSRLSLAFLKGWTLRITAKPVEIH